MTEINFLTNNTNETKQQQKPKDCSQGATANKTKNKTHNTITSGVISANKKTKFMTSSDKISFKRGYQRKQNNK
jgi:hypothetical protein